MESRRRSGFFSPVTPTKRHCIANSSFKALIISQSNRFIETMRTELANVSVESVNYLSALSQSEIQSLYVVVNPNLIVIDASLLAAKPTACHDFAQALIEKKAKEIILNYATNQNEKDQQEILRLINIVNQLGDEKYDIQYLTAERVQDLISSTSLQLLEMFIKNVEPSFNIPEFYIDAREKPDVLKAYLNTMRFNGTLCYSQQGTSNTISDSGSHSVDIFKLTTADTLGLGKLFTLLAVCVALNYEIDKPAILHPKLKEKLSKEIKIQFENGISVEQLMFEPLFQNDHSPINFCRNEINRYETLYQQLDDITQQSYGNYFLLGLIIESAINQGKDPQLPGWKSYYQFIGEAIFDPAGMHHTSSKANNSTQANTKLKHTPPCSPAGHWISCAEDLFQFLHWLRANYIKNQHCKKFIDLYLQHQPDAGNKKQILIHDKMPGAFACMRGNLTSGESLCIVSDSSRYFCYGFHHLITGKNIRQVVAEILQHAHPEPPAIPIIRESSR